MFAPNKDLVYIGDGSATSTTNNRAQAPPPMTNDECATVIETLNKRIINLVVPEGTKVHQIINKRCVESILCKNAAGTSAAVAATSALSGGGSGQPRNNKKSLITKLNNENAAIDAAMSTLATSKPSSNNHNITVLPRVAWTEMNTEQLEFIYREGVSIDTSRFCNGNFYNKLRENNNNTAPILLRFKVHLRIIQALQMNFLWFVNRIFCEIAGLHIETGAALSAYTPENNTATDAWADMEIASRVDVDYIPAAVDYLKVNHPKAYYDMKKILNELLCTLPTFIAVEFVINDSIIGMTNTQEEMSGADCVEFFGRITPFKQQVGGGSSVDGTELALFGSATTAVAPAVFEPQEVVGSAFGGGITDLSIDPVDDRGESWLKKATSALMASEGSSGKYHKSGSSSSKDVKFGKGESMYKNTDFFVLRTPSKGEELKKFSDAFIRCLGSRCEDIVGNSSEDGVYSGNVFPTDQHHVYENNNELFVAAVMCNPSAIYRLVTHMCFTLLIVRLRNSMEESIINREPANTGVGMRHHYSLGRNVSLYQPSNYPNMKYRISRKNCGCCSSCGGTSWVDNFRKNVTDGSTDWNKFRGNRPHNSHRHMAYNFLWLDELIAKIKKTDNEKITGRYDSLSSDDTAFDTLKSCFPFSQLHHLFCPNVIAIGRPDASATINFEHDKMKIKHSSTETVYGTQKANLPDAYDKLKSTVVKKGTDHQDSAKRSGLSIREFADNASKLPNKMRALVSALSGGSNEHDSGKNKPLAADLGLIHIHSNLIFSLLKSFIEIVGEDEFSKLIKNDENIKSSTSSNDIKPKLRNDIMAIAALAKFFFRNQNAAFATGINRQGFYSSTYVVNGMRGTVTIGLAEVKYHQALVSMISSVVYGDYFSNSIAGDKLNDMFGDEEGFLLKSAVKNDIQDKNVEMLLSSTEFNLFDDDEEQEEEEAPISIKRSSPPSSPNPKRQKVTDDDNTNVATNDTVSKHVSIKRTTPPSSPNPKRQKVTDDDNTTVADNDAVDTKEEEDEDTELDDIQEF